MRPALSLLGLALVLLAVGGCHDFDAAYRQYCSFSACDGGAGSDGGGGGGGDAGPVVTILAIDHYITGRGVVDVPSGPVLAFVDGGAVTLWQVDAGVFQFSAAPGTFYLAGRTPPGFDHALLVASTLPTLDLGQNNLGRPNVASVDAGTGLQIDATGIVAWNDNDVLELTSPGAGIGSEFLYIPSYPPTSGVVNPPAPGDTTLSMFVPWDQYSPDPLIDFNAGDQTLLYQLADTVTDSGIPYVHIASAFSPTLSILDGQTNNVSGTFAQFTTDSIAATFFYDTKGFTDLIPPKPPPGACSQCEGLFIEAMYGGLVYGPYAQMPDLAVIFVDAGTTTAKESLVFGNPFPASWSLAMLGGQLTQTPYNFTNGNGDTFAAVEETDVSVDLPFDAGITIHPLVAPPTGFQINGTIADGTASIPPTTTTPLVSWSPGPTSATLQPATYYTVRLAELLPNVGTPSNPSTPVAIVSFYTPGTQLTLPPGYLQPGHEYVVRITAVYDPNGGWPTRPFVIGYPYGLGQAPSAPFSP